MRTYGKLAMIEGRWVIWDLEPHVAIRLKAVFPSVPRHSAGPFTLDGEPVTCADLAWFCTRYRLDAAPDALARLEAGRRGFETIQAEAGRIMAADYQVPLFAGLRPGQEVRQHQARNAELLRRFGGLLVGDETGEGKSYTGAAAMLLPGALPATLVCDPHLANQWAQKLTEFTTLRPHVVKGTKPYALPAADVRIFGYTQLSGWIDHIELLGTGLAVFDEVDSLRHGVGTAKGAAAAKLVATARFKMGLSATPIFNYGDEIWNVLSFFRPEVLGEYEDFVREWCSTGREVKDPEALGSYLREVYAMTRKRGQGPRPNVIVHTIDHDAGRLAAVEDIAQDLAFKAKYGGFEESGQAVRQLDMLVRQETGVAKAPYVARYVQLLCEAGEQVVLFGWHRDVYDIWLRIFREAGLRPVLYTGSETPKQKDMAKEAFMLGRANPLIMSLRSGKGMDGIQAVCKVAVAGELDWSPSVHHQNWGRINREGQPGWPEPVTCIYLVARDGSDPSIQEVLGIKSSQAAGIMDPGLGVQRAPRDGSAIEALVERYLKRRAAA